MDHSGNRIKGLLPDILLRYLLSWYKLFTFELATHAVGSLDT